jgi:hypothetical protein
MFPFKEKNQDNYFVREFPANTNEMDLVWHMDAEDRTVESIGETDWLFQFDNELPVPIDCSIFIPKNTIHRVIKGTGSLKIKLIKHG